MRKILILTACLVIGVAIFLVFDKGSVSSTTFPELSLEKGGALLTAGFDKIKEKTAVLTADVKDFFSEKSEEAQEKTIDSVKNFIGEKLKEVGNNFVSSDGAISNVSGGNREIETRQFVFLSAKVGTIAYFTIRNSDIENSVNYSVDWQDGKKDIGKLEKGKSVLVSHKWEKGGEYIIDFKITGLNNIANYKIQLTIF